VAESALEVWWVPGSFELPTAARWAAHHGSREPFGAPAAGFDAVIALGCVIRGETEHFRLVADGAAQGLMRVALDTGVPVLNGVLAADDAAQAEARSGGEHGNTGAQVALAAVRMANLRRARGGR
jgi:6,7-dimethyl-8-ribityllumazine synthase